jgi:hypothetical protein
MLLAHRTREKWGTRVLSSRLTFLGAGLLGIFYNVGG